MVLPTDVTVGGPKVVAARIAEAVRQVLVKSERTANREPRTANREIAVGLGAPGLIIADTGVIHFSPNFPGWSDIPLLDYVNTELSKLRGVVHNPKVHANSNTYKPVLKGMDNDVNAMTLGELLHGAGVGYKSIVALTLGTGVGGGVVIDGRVYHGSQNTAGELGHTVVEPNGRYCGCGNQGCLEAYAGAKNIVERTQEKIETGRSTILTTATTKGVSLTPKENSSGSAIRGSTCN